MKIGIHIRFLIFLVAFLLSFAFARPPDLLNLKFEHLTAEDGLSQNSIYAILQDRTGFMWFGTHDGLNRYDGTRFRIFKYDPTDSTSISDNIVLALLEDSEGRLWVGTTNGLNCFDPLTERFTRYLSDPSDPNRLSHNTIRQLLQDRFGRIWVGTLGGVNCLDPKSGRLVRFLHDENDPRSLSSNWIEALLEDHNGDIWVGTSRGLDRLKLPPDGSLPPNLTFQHFSPHPPDASDLKNNLVNALFEDRSGNLWVTGTNFLAKLVQTNSPAPRFEYVNQRISTPIRIFYEDVAGRLWMQDWGGGLTVFNPRQGTFFTFQHDQWNPFSLSNNTVTSAYVSSEGILWVGTSGGGLNKAVLRQKPFRHYYHRTNDPNSLANRSIRGIYQSPDGMLWVGGYHGLDRLDPRTDRVVHYQAHPNDPNGLLSNSVRVIYPDPDYNGEVLWLGLESEIGLQRFERNTGRFTHFTQTSGALSVLSGHPVMAILKDRRGILWIGTIGGLKRYDERQGTVTFYTHDPTNPAGLGNHVVNALCEDRSGNLWIGTDNGLDCLRDGYEPFLHYRHDPDDPTSLSNNRIKCIYQASDGVLWIGTDGGGLNRLDPETKTFRYYSTRDGLPNEVIYGILEDQRGWLWLSTNRGLSRFDPQTETFQNYGPEDGLQGNEFNSGSYFKSASGEMFFGGLNGITAFFPQTIREDSSIPPVVFTAFKKMGVIAPLDTAITAKKIITLPPSVKVFSFEFRALSYVAPQKNRYAYRLAGGHNQWIELGNNPEVTFSNLSPGRYVLQVRGSNHDGVWNEQGASLTLIVLPYFWQRWWFRALVIALIFALTFLVFLIRTRNIRKRNKALQMEIEQRKRAEKQLQITLGEVEQLKDRLEEENTFLRREISTKISLVEDIIGESPAMKYVLHRLKQFAPTDTTVLILGETGTGKELFARAVHNLSSRKGKAFVKVNCAALPHNLIESELFGHEKGAFTGAQEQRKGRFELADGGTIFLDEIGELPLDLQAKLLRVLQEGQFERVGGTKTIKVDVRIIAATNRNLRREVQEGRFREDLYYRLNVFTLNLPPLRKRKEDIPLLLETMLQRFCQKHGKEINSIPNGVLKRLQNYDWPGNVRELENVIERAVITSPGKVLRLMDDLKPLTVNGSENGTFLSLEEMERQHILNALEKTGWKIEGSGGAAALLEINAATLRSRMKKLGIHRPQNQLNPSSNP